MALKLSSLTRFVKLPPAEAIAYLKAKGFQTTFDYDEMMWEAHHEAFTVAKIAREDLLRDIRASLIAAQVEGIPFARWKQQIKPTLQKKGWWGEVEALNPATGEVKSIYVGSRRLRTIFYTNMRVAYQAGKAERFYRSDAVVYLRYVAILDERTRPSHRAMHGKVLPKDHHWWQQNFPPNGWNCRCRVSPVGRASKKRYEDAGDFIDHDTMPETIASRDWAYDVRNQSRQLEAIRRNKAKRLDTQWDHKAAEAIAMDKALIESIDTDISPVLKSYLLAHRPKIKHHPANIAPASYAPATQTLRLKNPTIDPQTLRHELGHHIDNIHATDGILWSQIHLDKSIRKDLQWWTNRQKTALVEILSEEAYQEDVQFQDLFYTTTKRKYGEKTRRDEKVIDRKLIAAEFFANVFQMILSGDPKLDIIREYFPTSVAKVESFIKELK